MQRSMSTGVYACCTAQGSIVLDLGRSVAVMCRRHCLSVHNCAQFATSLWEKGSICIHACALTVPTTWLLPSSSTLPDGSYFSFFVCPMHMMWCMSACCSRPAAGCIATILCMHTKLLTCWHGSTVSPQAAAVLRRAHRVFLLCFRPK